VSMFSASPFGLPFAVLGLWKCGFPETMACFQEAFLEASERRINLAAVCAYLNGMGTLLHHCAAAYCIVAVVTHLCPLSRSVLALSLPLVLQHVIVLLRYRSLPLYGVLELLLEIFFEVRDALVLRTLAHTRHAPRSAQRILCAARTRHCPRGRSSLPTLPSPAYPHPSPRPHPPWQTELLAQLPRMKQSDGYDATIRGSAMTMLLAHWCRRPPALDPSMLGTSPLALSQPYYLGTRPNA
jgi:hypothetical protein